MARADLVLVVARGANGVIGREGDLPWRLRSDLQRFKALTIGKPCIMGRRTWESLPLKPLPGRLNLVLSRDLSFEAKGAVVVTSLDEALSMAREHAADDGVTEICVIGGAGLFEAALPRARRLYITEVEASPDGDVRFPDLDETAWTEVSREPHPAGDKDDHAFVFRVLERP
ncbi:dihydrofolate reductase [Brevundimonas sp. S30B]|uniref:dihydrofolate reductase n=1 Tax=unclassified Brevundimonas TaxID=2622653 RepID=UPI00107213C4|nr:MULTISPECIES: dihydrofolate reductase [unclassified Brevundimonas]QBX37831.1 dihydrofolate reductase [Brevundimonas sp. MF30-B]TFW02813.1 dihydrofolate reductase [Brevundimonas sp. S30B]